MLIVCTYNNELQKICKMSSRGLMSNNCRWIDTFCVRNARLHTLVLCKRQNEIEHNAINLAVMYNTHTSTYVHRGERNYLAACKK